ncbi:hypothetical protein P8452_25062 [Trifolium repens]|nr:hypothetical protein P8452_25062 [Trifolium repens]
MMKHKQSNDLCDKINMLQSEDKKLVKNIKAKKEACIEIKTVEEEVGQDFPPEKTSDNHRELIPFAREKHSSKANTASAFLYNSTRRERN